MPGAGAVKLLLCIALMAGECLPRGGTLTVQVGPNMTVEIIAAGDGASACRSMSLFRPRTIA
jgi:hypothetical protein